MSDVVRVRKLGTREGRPVTLDDGHVVEGHEVEPARCGQPYQVRRTVVEHDDAPEVFSTSPIRAIVLDATGGITLITDNSRYAVEAVGR